MLPFQVIKERDPKVLMKWNKKLQNVIVYLGVHLSKNFKMYYDSHLLFCVIHAVDQAPILSNAPQGHI